jgi:hypothetical protein
MRIEKDLYNRGTIISIDGQKHNDGNILYFLDMGEEIDNAIKMSKEKATSSDERCSSNVLVHWCPITSIPECSDPKLHRRKDIGSFLPQKLHRDKGEGAPHKFHG